MNEDEFFSRLDTACASLGLELDQDKKEKLKIYWQLFIKWNAVYNLSALRDAESILNKHLVDSLSVVPQMQKSQAQRCIDVGTGGGLPGIPLAICFPERHFTLLDSAGKKMRFLFQVCQSLGLTNVSLENCRVEALQAEQPFDVVISRAFASLKKMTDLCNHLLHIEGQFWAMKGVFPQQELSEIEKHYIVAEHHTLLVPNVEGERCLLILKKIDE